MPTPSELLPILAESRLDVMGFGLVLAGAYAGSRRYLRRRMAAQFLGRSTLPLLIAHVVLGALGADSTRLVIDYPAVASVSTLLTARGFVWAIFTLNAMVMLGSAVRLALMRSEISHHTETERQLHEAKIAADEGHRAKSDFLAVMSHEIRTPLNAVMGFANLLEDTHLDESQRGYVTTIAREGARLKSLVNDLLDLTKMEKGRLALERLPIAPAETAHDVLRLFSARAAEKNLELRLEAQLAGPLVVSGDPVRFHQILVNLVDNAVKFTSSGTISVFMSWEAPRTVHVTGLLRIRISDTGIGIAPENLSGLFQMFTQADSSTSRRFGGTGLGLAICQRLVQLMGGEITAQSRLGEGSTFELSLPFTPVAGPVEPAPAPTSREPVLSFKPRILVVDDMETNRLLLEVFLRRSGFEPELAADGEQAITLARTKHYDAILMDLQMPAVDGYTATRRIRENEHGSKRTPIIALTASITLGTREKCLAAGMSDYLTKPLDLSRFRTVLHRLITNSASTAG